MSLSARIAVEPSRRVAWAALVVPVVGLSVAAATLVVRWPADGAALIVAAVAFGLLIVGSSARRLLRGRRVCRLILSDRSELDVHAPDFEIDGTCRLVESTVVWSGFWILALQPEGKGRIRRLAFEPSRLRAEARRSLARFLIWSTRERGDRVAVPEKSTG